MKPVGHGKQQKKSCKQNMCQLISKPISEIKVKDMQSDLM